MDIRLSQFSFPTQLIDQHSLDNPCHGIPDFLIKGVACVRLPDTWLPVRWSRLGNLPRMVALGDVGTICILLNATTTNMVPHFWLYTSLNDSSIDNLLSNTPNGTTWPPNFKIRCAIPQVPGSLLQCLGPRPWQAKDSLSTRKGKGSQHAGHPVLLRAC